MKIIKFILLSALFCFGWKDPLMSAEAEECSSRSSSSSSSFCSSSSSSSSQPPNKRQRLASPKPVEFRSRSAAATGHWLSEIGSRPSSSYSSSSSSSSSTSCNQRPQKRQRLASPMPVEVRNYSAAALSHRLVTFVPTALELSPLEFDPHCTTRFPNAHSMRFTARSHSLSRFVQGKDIQDQYHGHLFTIVAQFLGARSLMHFVSVSRELLERMRQNTKLWETMTTTEKMPAIGRGDKGSYESVFSNEAARWIFTYHINRHPPQTHLPLDYYRRSAVLKKPPTDFLKEHLFPDPPFRVNSLVSYGLGPLLKALNHPASPFLKEFFYGFVGQLSSRPIAPIVGLKSQYIADYIHRFGRTWAAAELEGLHRLAVGGDLQHRNYQMDPYLWRTYLQSRRNIDPKEAISYFNANQDPNFIFKILSTIAHDVNKSFKEESEETAEQAKLNDYQGLNKAFKILKRITFDQRKKTKIDGNGKPLIDSAIYFITCQYPLNSSLALLDILSKFKKLVDTDYIQDDVVEENKLIDEWNECIGSLLEKILTSQHTPKLTDEHYQLAMDIYLDLGHECPKDNSLIHDFNTKAAHYGRKRLKILGYSAPPEKFRDMARLLLFINSLIPNNGHLHESYETYNQYFKRLGERLAADHLKVAADDICESISGLSSDFSICFQYTFKLPSLKIANNIKDAQQAQLLREMAINFHKRSTQTPPRTLTIDELRGEAQFYDAIASLFPETPSYEEEALRYWQAVMGLSSPDPDDYSAAAKAHFKLCKRFHDALQGKDQPAPAIQERQTALFNAGRHFLNQSGAMFEANRALELKGIEELEEEEGMHPDEFEQDALHFQRALQCAKSFINVGNILFDDKDRIVAFQEALKQLDSFDHMQFNVRSEQEEIASHFFDIVLSYNKIKIPSFTPQNAAEQLRAYNIGHKIYQSLYDLSLKNIENNHMLSYIVVGAKQYHQIAEGLEDQKIEATQEAERFLTHYLDKASHCHHPYDMIDAVEDAVVLFLNLNKPDQAAETYNIMGDAWRRADAQQQAKEAYAKALSLYTTQVDNNIVLQKIADVQKIIDQEEGKEESKEESKEDVPAAAAAVSLDDPDGDVRMD